MQCAAHPGTETVLRCGKCETPICPRCTVQTPVGARCRNCGSNRSSPLFHASPRQYALATLAALATGLVLGWLPRMLFVLGPAVYGYAVGEATLRAGGRRRGSGMEIVAGLGAFVGIVLWSLWFLGGPEQIGRMLAALPLSQFLVHVVGPFDLIALILGIGCAVVHIRYI